MGDFQGQEDSKKIPQAVHNLHHFNQESLPYSPRTLRTDIDQDLDQE